MPDAAPHADVVVLGSGAAGLMAAVEAADHGAATVIIEREPVIGGSTRLSGGYVALCETELQPGTRAELFADLAESHHHDADEALSRLYVYEASSMCDRLGQLGLRFAGTTQFAHMSKAWGHELPLGSIGGGAQIVEKLEQAAKQRGVRFATSTPARRLIRDSSGGVVAVETVRNGHADIVNAAKAVVIGTGGFTRNRSLIRNFGRPGTDRIYPITGEGSQGEGLVMGMALGAATAYLGPGIAPTGPVEPITGKGSLVNYSGAILVNKQGLRFCDESASYLDISWAGLGQPDSQIIQVFDEAILADYMKSMIGQTLSGWKVHQGGTVEAALRGAAAECGLDIDAAVATVQEYNRFVENGEDPRFGRRHLIGVGGDLVKINAPPYYAIVAVPGTTHFNGGLKIDTDMRVVDLYGDPIDRLFAAGEVTGGFHGSGYLSATHLGSALIFGRRAGFIATN